MDNPQVPAERVESVLRTADRPLSVKRVADELGIDWHTAKKRLTKLRKQNKVHRVEIHSRLTLYWDQPISIGDR